jgi:hypothetical protein
VFRPVLGSGGGAGGQRAPDDRHRRRRQGADVDGQRRQPRFVQAAVDSRPLAAAVEDHVDAAEGAFVGLRAVFGTARGARAVVGGVDVEAAVRLPQRPHVGPHFLFEEELVEADEIAIAAAGGDLRQRDDLVAVVVVGGRDVDHRPRPRRLPAPDRVGKVAAPGAEGLDHRRVLVHRFGEVAEVGHVAGVGDAEVDLLAGRLEERPGGGRSGGREGDQQQAGEDGPREFCFRQHGGSVHACKRAAPARAHTGAAQARLRNQAASGATCSAINARTSSEYFSMKLGPTPLIASREPSSCGRAVAIAVRVLLAATV